MFFQLCAIDFELSRGINLAAIYCLVRNKIQVVYDRMLKEVNNIIILASPERILLDFESEAFNALRTAFPNATVTGCYFNLTQSVMRKLNEIGMKEDYKMNDVLRLALRFLPALAMVPSSDVTEVFLILADNMYFCNVITLHYGLL